MTVRNPKNRLGLGQLGLTLGSRLGLDIHRRQGTRREGSREAWIWWPAPLETWASVRKQGNHDMAHGLLDQGGPDDG